MNFYLKHVLIKGIYGKSLSLHASPQIEITIIYTCPSAAQQLRLTNFVSVV